MKFKKYALCLLPAFLLAFSTACEAYVKEVSIGSDSSSVSTEIPETDNPAAGEASAAADEIISATEENNAEDSQGTESGAVQLEEARDAASGQAYLAIVDEKWWIQYWGSSTRDGSMLAYNAGIADITGDGTYKVSVTADTNGFRYDTTQNTDEQYVPAGLGFLAVIIKDGESLSPDAVITVEKISVDGKEVALTAKGYTNNEDGAVRTNIYNKWVTSPPADARSSEGLDDFSEYSAQTVDTADFDSWMTVEVEFTVSGWVTSSSAQESTAG
jgi:flagellar motor protein MotB